MKRHTVTLAVLATAVAFYAAGWSTGAAALCAAGAVFELMFWTRILRGQ